MTVNSIERNDRYHWRRLELDSLQLESTQQQIRTNLSKRSMETYRFILLPLCYDNSLSVSSTVRPSPSSCSARTPARSPGPSSSVACTRRVSLRRLPRSAPAALSSTSVLSSVLPGRLSAPSATRSPRSVLLPVPPLSAMARTRRSRRMPARRLPRPRCVFQGALYIRDFVSRPQVY